MGGVAVEVKDYLILSNYDLATDRAQIVSTNIAEWAGCFLKLISLEL